MAKIARRDGGVELFKAIKPSTLLDTPDEWHALVLGLGEVICPWPPHFNVLELKNIDALISERHYYYTGRALGVLVWLGIIAVIKAIFT
jgi:hypothetical protein